MVTHPSSSRKSDCCQATGFDYRSAKRQEVVAHPLSSRKSYCGKTKGTIRVGLMFREIEEDETY
jgi:hypothetical protein